MSETDSSLRPGTTWEDRGAYRVSLDPQGSSGWFLARKDYITASRVAYAADLSNFKTPERYAYEFVTGAREIFTKEALKRMGLGVTHEPDLRRAYVALTGFEVTELGLAVSKRNTLLACSPDGVVTDLEGQTGLVEFKYVKNLDPNLRHIATRAKGIKDYDHIPREHYCQMQQQLYVMDLAWCDYAVYDFTASQFYVERIPFHPVFWADVEARLRYFMDVVVLEVRDNLGKYRSKYRDLYEEPRDKEAIRRR